MSIQVKVVSIVFELLVLVAGFLIGRNYLGLVQDWPGRVKSQVGEGLAVDLFQI